MDYERARLAHDQLLLGIAVSSAGFTLPALQTMRSCHLPLAACVVAGDGMSSWEVRHSPRASPFGTGLLTFCAQHNATLGALLPALVATRRLAPGQAGSVGLAFLPAGLPGSPAAASRES